MGKTIILDTSILIEILKGKYKVEKLKNKKLGITSINLHEILYGLKKLNKKIPEELELLTILPFTSKDAFLSSEIEAKMEKIGFQVPRIDCMIAAICINNKATLITRDKHFEKIASIFNLSLL